MMDIRIYILPWMVSASSVGRWSCNYPSARLKRAIAWFYLAGLRSPLLWYRFIFSDPSSLLWDWCNRDFRFVDLTSFIFVLFLWGWGCFFTSYCVVYAPFLEVDNHMVNWNWLLYVMPSVRFSEFASGCILGILFSVAALAAIMLLLGIAYQRIEVLMLSGCFLVISPARTRVVQSVWQRRHFKSIPYISQQSEIGGLPPLVLWGRAECYALGM